jgi:hypothetical protein
MLPLLQTIEEIVSVGMGGRRCFPPCAKQNRVGQNARYLPILIEVRKFARRLDVAFVKRESSLGRNSLLFGVPS